MKFTVLLLGFCGLGFLTTPAFGDTYNYHCYPERSNPEHDIYLLAVNPEVLMLGTNSRTLKKAAAEDNQNMNFLSRYVQYGGEINDLRSEGTLKAYLKPDLLKGGSALPKGGRGGQMILIWSTYLTRDSAYICVSK